MSDLSIAMDEAVAEHHCVEHALLGRCAICWVKSRAESDKDYLDRRMDLAEECLEQVVTDSRGSDCVVCHLVFGHEPWCPFPGWLAITQEDRP